MLSILMQLLLLGGQANAAGSIHVESRVECLDATSLEERLGALVQMKGGTGHMSVSVVSAPTVDGIVLTLRVIMSATGELVLERTFPLKPEDCPSSGELLALVLEQFLSTFPLEEWILKTRPPEPPPPEKIVLTRDMAELAGSASLAVDSRWPYPSADLEFGVALDVGSSSHRLIGSAALRVGIPHELGSGSYLESMGLLGVGWRYATRGWMLRAEVRTGGLLVSGFGYTTNYHRWLLWVEAQVGMMWEWKGVLLGPQIAVSPLWHRVETTAGAGRQLPWLRVGVVIGFPFWYKKF